MNSFLWVASSVITVSVMLATLTGIGLAAEFLLVSVSAAVFFIKASSAKNEVTDGLVPWYILTIVAFLLLNMFRFGADYTTFLTDKFPGLFKHGFRLNPVSWFIVMVCLPVSAMLFGGYLFIRKNPIGIYLACWGLVLCCVESLIQFTLQIFYEKKLNMFLGGSVTAIFLFLLGSYGIIAMIRPGMFSKSLASFPKPEPYTINLWTILLVTLVLIYGVTLYTQAGILPVAVVAGSMMGGLLGWRKTTAKSPANPYKLVPLYLLIQALFYVHVGEEMLTHFNRGIMAISGHPWSDSSYGYVIAFGGPCIWIFAAWSLWKGQAFGNFVLWFMIVGMILGEPTHIIVFPVVRMVKEGAGYEYFSGMYTSLFPMIPAIIALLIILKDSKQRKINKAYVKP